MLLDVQRRAKMTESPPQKRAVFAVLIVCALVFLVGGALGMVTGIDYVRRAEESLNWHITEAAVLTTDITTTTLGTRARTRPGTSLWYVPRISYQYTVDGVTYESNNISFDPDFMTFRERNDAYAFLGQYRNRTDVPVHYDPASTERSVLIPGETGQTYTPILISSLAVFLGLLCAIAAFRERARRAPAALQPDSMRDS
jgi:hypothetical protein